MSLTAIMPSSGRIRSFFGPFEDGELRAAAMNCDPANGVLTFFAADFAFVDSADQAGPPGTLSRCSIVG